MMNGFALSKITYLLDAGVELCGGSGHGQVLLRPLRGHLDHLREVGGVGGLHKDVGVGPE